MTEALACTQQALLTYLLEVLIVDDTPSNRKEPFFCLRVRHQKNQWQMPSALHLEL